MSRKCSACKQVGHTIRGCMDPDAGVRVSELMSETDMAVALELCGAMSAGHVSFALCHGLGEKVSGGRSKLVELVKTRTAKHFLSHPPNLYPLPSPGAFNRPMLHTVLELEKAQMHELVNMLNTVKEYNLDEDVKFLDPTLPTTASAKKLIRQNAIVRISNRVLDTIYTMFATQPEMYVSALVSNEDQMDSFMNIAAAALRVEISTYAKAYMMIYIRMNTFIMRIRYMSALLGTSALRRPSEMKALKTVITCCPIVAPLDDEDAPKPPPDTCSVCFDNLTPSRVVRTGCDHTFCSDCIGDWAKERGMKSFIQCPCCRAEIDNITVYDPEERLKVERGLAAN